MDQPTSHARLIIVCGLPGSGKTTHAKQLEAKLSAILFCPDEWLDALSVDIWDDRMRGKIEALQWQVGQQLLAVGVNVIIEWGCPYRKTPSNLKTQSLRPFVRP